MKEILSKIVDKIFDDVPFSRKSENLKEEVNTKLEEKYTKDTKTKSELKSLGEILNKCDNVEHTCKLLDCNIEKEVIENKNQSSDKTAKKNIKTLKKYLILKSIFISVIFANFLLVICNFKLFNFLHNLLVTAIDLVIIYLIHKKYVKEYEKLKFSEKKYNQAGKKYIYNFYDKYSKKLNNCIMLDITVISYFIIFGVISVIMSKYTITDITSALSYMATIIEILLFITLKNYFYRNLVGVYFTDNRNNLFKKFIKQVIKISCIYYAISLILIILLTKLFTNFSNVFMVFGVIYFIVALLINLILRKEYVFKNININIKKIVTISLIVIVILGYNFMSMDLFLTQPFINNVSNQLEKKDDISYNEETGVYTITTEKDEFKILQLTDIHLGGSIPSYGKDIKALKACLKLIEETKPDFVVVTGDLVFPMGIMSLSLNNNAPVMQFAAFMRNTGIPWAFTYGNHDTESMSKLNENDFNDLMKSLSYKTSNNLLYPYIQPDIYGRSNQRIEIRHKDGSIMQELYLIDSNDYIAESKKVNEYDYIHDDQVDWYKKSLLDIEEKEGYMPNSMIFFHIPLREYKEANDLYESGSSEVKYYYGILGETMIDKICTSKYDSKLFDTAVELGSTKAMFFGHDHYNNQSLEYKGIRMTYGYSIDYLAMPGIEDDSEQRGGTLITINKDATFDIKPYKLDDLK